MYEKIDDKLTKVKPEQNICRYDESSHHKNCKHQTYCMFNENRIHLESDITGLENEIEHLKEVNEDYLNGDVIYIDELKEFIEKEDYVSLRHKVKSLISIKESELLDLVRFRNRVLDGEIGGYGYGQ